MMIVSLLFQSCFSVKKARAVDIHEIDAPGNGGDLSFTFEFNGNIELFEKRSRSYFNLKEKYFPYSFTTKALYPDEELTVFISIFEDDDKYVQLVTLSGLLGTRDKEKEPTVKKTMHHYISIQVTDAEGNDILQEKSLRQQTVMERLRFYQRMID
ncbi:hypothetical protein [Mesonia mobilis]|uniref:hypothetical protein n=1 Tax=Mesonia mobilis TaxID=369791 RepID=UPI0026EEB56F|nr:hypothetical protein [Mesonia mobilis]